MSNFQNSFLHALAVWCYLLKLKRGVGLVFSACFVHTFPYNVPYLILYQLTKFQYQSHFLSQDIKQDVFLNSFIAN